MAREMICISCPIGCRLRVETDAQRNILVSGNGCARGVAYAEAEMRAPTRVVTLCVRAGADGSVMLPCKTKEAFPKELIPKLIAELKEKRAGLPIALGDVIMHDALGTGIDVVATRSMAEKAGGHGS
jgi:CxxC motif-containing protein